MSLGWDCYQFKTGFHHTHEHGFDDYPPSNHERSQTTMAGSTASIKTIRRTSGSRLSSFLFLSPILIFRFHISFVFPKGFAGMSADNVLLSKIDYKHCDSTDWEKEKKP